MKRTKKIISTFLTLTFLLSMLNSSSVFAASFADINDVPWAGAATYINAVADLGLMVGDRNANGQAIFRAKDSVTYCEAVQLVFTLLKNKNNITVSNDIVNKWTPSMVYYNIPNWVYPALSYCLDKNIVTLTDLPKFILNGVNNNVTREDVALFFGRALEGFYTVNSNVILSFKDSTFISYNSARYVDLLVRLNIIVGDDSNKFNPLNLINRAEMAVVTYKTYNCLSSATSPNTPTSPTTPTSSTTPTSLSMSGTVTSLETQSTGYLVTIAASNGSGKYGFYFNAATPIYNGTVSVSIDEINANDILAIDYDSNNLVKKITIIYNTSSTKDLLGTIYSVNANALSLRVNTTNTSYSYASNVKITYDDIAVTLTQLMAYFYAKDTVYATITVNAQNQIVAISASASLLEYDDCVSGKIDSVTNSSLKFKGTSATFNLTDKKTLEIDITDGLDSDFAIETLDDLITAVYDDSKIIKASVYSYNNKVVRITGEVIYSSGELVLIKTKTNTIRIKNSVENIIYDYDDDVYIDINNHTSTITALYNALTTYDSVYVELTLTDGYVTEIYAYTDYSGSSSTTKRIQVSGELSIINTVYLQLYDDTTKYYFSDSVVPAISITDGTLESDITTLAALMNADEEGKIITATIYTENSIIVKVSGEVTRAVGVISRISPSNSRIVIISPINDNILYYYSFLDNVEIKVDTDIISIRDLEALFDVEDIRVTLYLEDNVVYKIVGRTL